MRAEIFMERLECGKTTEQGADEVYILVAGKRSDGQKYSARLPGDYPSQPSGHWDMNDSGDAADNPNGDSRHISRKSLFVGELSPGQSWDIVVSFMEEDLGPAGANATKTFGDALVATGNPYAVAAGALFDLLGQSGILRVGVDSDDYIGSFAVHITNQNGDLSFQWREIDRVAQKLDFGKGMGGFEFDMVGDGSLYKAWVYGRQA